MQHHRIWPLTVTFSYWIWQYVWDPQLSQSRRHNQVNNISHKIVDYLLLPLPCWAFYKWNQKFMKLISSILSMLSWFSVSSLNMLLYIKHPEYIQACNFGLKFGIKFLAIQILASILSNPECWFQCPIMHQPMWIPQGGRYHQGMTGPGDCLQN